MKRFLKTLLFFIGIPIVLLLGLYLWSDPFKCINQFDINDIDDTNREYLSTELFLRNEKSQQYNSFIFCSSRGGGMNTYRWKTYLSSDARPFVFQAWSETLTGIEMKMDYLNENHVPINNALLMLDIPGAFSEVQLPKKALSMKHFLFTGKTRFQYNVTQFYNFIQKPSLWLSNFKKRMKHVKITCQSDTISNDWDKNSRWSYNTIPEQDSLKYCSTIVRNSFLSEIAQRGNNEIEISKPLITKSFEEQMRHIKAILDSNGTNYYVILTPAYCYTNPAVNPSDLKKIKTIFGIDRVCDYTGKNEMTDDYNNFTDPNHFGQRVGWMILADIYK